MGSGVFKPALASPEEREFICNHMAKEMMTVSIPPALVRAKTTIEIKLPPDFDRMKKAIAELRQSSANLKSSGGDEQPAAEEQPAQTDATDGGGEQETEQKQSGGGGFGGMLAAGLSKAKEAAGAVVDKVSSVASTGIASGLDAVADLLDDKLAKVEEPMSKIGQNLVENREEQIKKVLSNCIVGTKVENASELCKGPNTALSDFFIAKSATSIARQLEAVVADYIKEHAAIKAWEAAINQYNSAIEKILALHPTISQTLALKGISLNIQEYVCEQTVRGMAVRMGEEEVKIREDPFGKCANHMETFSKVFKQQPLNRNDYKRLLKMLNIA